MRGLSPEKRSRIVAALLAGGLQLLLAAALVFGLGSQVMPVVGEAMQVFEVPPSAPPPVAKPRPRPAATRKPNGRAAPPALRAKAAIVVAPPPVIVPDVPPPLVAALTAGQGNDASAGAAPRPGPGTGAGGSGTGTGSGDEGEGEGDGGDTPSEWTSGRLRDSDYPRAAYEAGISGTVRLRYVVGVNGRVTACRVTGSSGNAALDETTCRLIKQRLRFRPARDRQGRKVPDVWTGEHVWAVMPGVEPPR